uniref:hypothetical protein n=1 Tax=Streptomyces asiaticus TaxID=114695 RepID=UPI00374D8E8A
MAIMSLGPTGKGRARRTMRWKTALNAFDITFDRRLSAARQQVGPNDGNAEVERDLGLFDRRDKSSVTG